ncbi:DUF418 domain-containing protein [Pseudonocardia sp. KRD291]|uniref:DUF418 domain-containing protein n=1 Tax=Pseudonocardia sp. KRD291 TaxID=2792007 RepID=UPI001C49E9F0|nr:DUF418 domain-containing protein [Pseudonocardia sp. KRD291]MBW0102670.1 DUF418 domain-containing protein [Pseudonocardia sp. KRD291]
MTAAEPGATPAADRAPAPDLARGAMLLLIALANVHRYVFGAVPGELVPLDRAVVLVETVLVDGRAYPLFGLLFGYGVVQLARRRDAGSGVALVRRRGGWMIAIGLAHGLLLWSGEIVGAYGLLAVVLAGVLVRGSEATLATVAIGGLAMAAALTSGVPPVPGSPQGSFVSITLAGPAEALVARAGEWVLSGLLGQAVGVAGAVALGALAARARLLDEPQQHRVLLVRTAVLGLAAAVLGGLPQALLLVGAWSPPAELAGLSSSVHTLGGYGGAAGYAALFALLAIRPGRGHGRVAGAMRATGQRSLSCYLAQSVVFVALFPAWTLGLGSTTPLWGAALVGIGTWLLTVALAVASARTGRRGPAEAVLRRLTYARRRTIAGPGPARGA